MIGSWQFGVLGVFWGIFVGNVLSGVVAIVWVRFSVLPKIEKRTELTFESR
jgi:Na+-driven multidrug efflux pump